MLRVWGSFSFLRSRPHGEFDYSRYSPLAFMNPYLELATQRWVDLKSISTE